VTQVINLKSFPTPPVAPRWPHSVTAHGITVVDNYAWLKHKNRQEVRNRTASRVMSGPDRSADSRFRALVSGKTGMPA